MEGKMEVRYNLFSLSSLLFFTINLQGYKGKFYTKANK